MGLIGVIGTIIVGFIVGGIAKWLSPGPKPDGCIVTILIGIAGAMIAKYVGSEVFHWYRDGSAPGWIMSILGAVLLLWVLRLLQNRG